MGAGRIFRRMSGVVAVLLLCLTATGVVFVVSAEIERLAGGGFRGRLRDGTISRGDQEYYITAALYFRGQATRRDLRVPFAFRVLPSVIAAGLPFRDVRSSFLVLNLVSGGIAAAVTYFFLVGLRFPARAALAGALLYCCSFPSFYYAPGCWSDPLAMAFLAAGVLSIYLRRFFLYLLVATVGVLCRETNLVVVLIFGACETWVDPRSPSGQRGRLRTAAGVLTPVLALLAVRWAFRDLGKMGPDETSLESFALNLLRPRAYASAFFTLWFAVPALAWFYLSRLRGRREAIFRTPRDSMFVLVASCALGLIPLSALLAAYLDGRFFWPLYPVAIPFAVGCWLKFRGDPLRSHVRP